MDIPEFARAAVVREFGKPIQIEEVPIPKEVEPRALLVKIDATSMCGTDVHLWEGSLALKVDLPVILGHEMVGTIVAMGEDSELDSVGNLLKIGDRVVWTHSDCGHCYFCTIARQPTLCSHRRSYMYESMEKPPFLMGAFATYGYILPGSGRVKVPDEVNDVKASLSSCAFRSVINATDQVGEIKATDTVVIQGTGPLGILATGVMRQAGAKRIIAIGAPESRLELAREFGADEVISIDEVKSSTDRLNRVLELTGGMGADVVFEFSGHPVAFAEGLQLVRKGGRYMVVGQLGEGKTDVQPSLITKKNIRVMGSFSGDVSHYWEALQFIAAYQDKYPFHKLITHEYSLDEINVCIQRMQAFEEIKPVIYPWK